MIEYLIHAIKHLVFTYGTLGIFTGAFLEEIFAPIPSATVMLSASIAYLGGKTVSLSTITILVTKIAIPVALGLTIGSLFLYGLAYAFGKPFIDKYGKYFGLSWAEVEKLEKKLEKSKSDELGLFLLRATPFVPFAPLNVLCGLIRWPMSTYLFLTFSGAFVRTCIFSAVGWQLGTSYRKHAGEFHYIENGITILIVALVVVFIAWRWKVSRKKKLEKN